MTVLDSTRIDISNGDACIDVAATLQCGPNRDVYTTSGLAFHGVERGINLSGVQKVSVTAVYFFSD